MLRSATRELAPIIERTARLGYASIGVVYIIIGIMTAAAGAGIGGKVASWQDAIAKVSTMPLGTIALIVIAIGVFGYSAWLLSSAISDGDRRGNDPKGLALRTGNAISAIVHIAIAAGVLRFAITHSHRGAGQDAAARHWTARVMDMPFGRILVAIAGIALLAYGARALYSAWQAKLSSRLHIPNIAMRPAIVAICRFGIAARGIVVMVVGASVVFAALHHNPGITKGSKGALTQLYRAPHGGFILIVVAFGLAAYGVYEIVKARYRTVNAT